MSRWWRAYDDAINDPKILKLSDKLHRVWFGLLCVSSKNDGSIPPIEDAALMLRMKPERLEEHIKNLCAAGLFDEIDGVLKPHNWDKRQYKSDVSTDRVKRFRNKGKTVTETPPETEQIQRTEQIKESRAVAQDDWPTNYGDLFWQAYPRKTEKLAAMKKLATLRKQGIVTFADLMAGVKRYAASVVGKDPQYVKQPPAWLNAGRWSDEIQPENSHGNRNSNTRTTGHDAMLTVQTRKARAIDGDDAVAGATDAPGFAASTDGRGSDGNLRTVNGSQRDHQRVEPDAERVREGEIIPPDKNAAGHAGGRFLV